MPKICLFISSLHKSGAERVMAGLADYLCDRGWETVLVTQHTDPDEYTLRHGIPRRLSDIEGREISRSRILNFVRRYRKLQKIWKEERPDLILSFIGKNNVMALGTSARYHIPCVVAVRGNPAREYKDPEVRKQAFRLFPKAAGVVLQTERAADYFPEDIRRISVVLPNPLNAAFLRPVYTGEREKTITAVGRLDANKNQSMMIDAFDRIRERFPEYRLMIYGEGEDRKKLESKIAAMHLQDRVFLPGSISNVPEVLEKTSAFLLTSDSEGLPNAIIEAMALGVPVIATDCPCGGPAYLIQDGENGLLVPCRDTEKLASALGRVLENREFAGELGRRALYVREKFAPEKALAAWETYLRSVCGGAEHKGRNGKETA
jgi:glycosyltransferase involved in cell wall biosynthesis